MESLATSKQYKFVFTLSEPTAFSRTLENVSKDILLSLNPTIWGIIKKTMCACTCYLVINTIFKGLLIYYICETYTMPHHKIEPHILMQLSKILWLQKRNISNIMNLNLKNMSFLQKFHFRIIQFMAMIYQICFHTQCIVYFLYQIYYMTQQK